MRSRVLSRHDPGLNWQRRKHSAPLIEEQMLSMSFSVMCMGTTVVLNS